MIRVSLMLGKYVDMACELYEPFEELKGRLFKLFGVPADLFMYLGFFELQETEKYFDEAFIEDFVRISDVLGSMEL